MNHNYKRITESIFDLIGNTPLLRLSKIAHNAEGNILLKLENRNPSGSLKDRMARKIIEEAEREGLIQPGVTTIVESSSGNTAIALSFVSAVKGYKVKVRVHENTATPEKLKYLKRYGAEYELMSFNKDDTEADKLAKNAGLHGATVEIPGRLKCFEEEKATPNTFWARQFSNKANWQAQSEIGREILEQTEGKVDTFIASIGTGGTFYGVAKVLKDALPKVRCIALQPTGWEGWQDPLSFSAKYIPGITGGIVKEIRDSGLADELRYLGTSEAVAMAYRLSQEEGVNCGISTAACVCIALEEASKPGMRGRNVVTVMVDGADRYISNETFIT